jgi:L-aspartate oxidase
MKQAQSILDTLAANVSPRVVATRKAFEATNMLTVASAVVAAAQARTESRGCHRRVDHPEQEESWLRHLEVTLRNGHMETA